MKSGQYTSIGGQAVLEGVMMRSPRFIAVAVRKPNGRIALKSKRYDGIATRFPFFRKPVLRGVVTLVESMVQGMQALSYSASLASLSESKDGKAEPELTNLAIAGSMAFAFALAMGLFVALPHFLSSLLASVDSPLFHAADGLIKMAILLTYVSLIGRMPDIRRVFQFHGAEHKSIFTFEAGQDLTVENARKFVTLHPRCGTSFLLFLIVISIAVFTFLFPVMGWTHFSETPILNHLAMVGIKIGLMLPVAGLAYEFIKACAGRLESPIARILMWPGLTLQYLTTREPDDSQLEVALVSLRKVLLLEKSLDESSGVGARDFPEEETEIGLVTDIQTVAASVAQFPEA